MSASQTRVAANDAAYPRRRRRPAHPHAARPLSARARAIASPRPPTPRRPTGACASFAFDLIVLDVMMPGESGSQFAARLRAGPEPLRSAPILMLTALHRDREPRRRARGRRRRLSRQAFRSARTVAAHRHAFCARSARVPRGRRDPCVRFGPFAFDPARGELARDGETVRLTDRERDMLQTLVRTRGRHRLARGSGGARGGAQAAERTVDVEVARLRRKIETRPANAPLHLQTVRGQGYRLLVEPTAKNAQLEAVHVACDQ